MLHLLTIFVSAFLLFQVQPLVARLILPLFGGGAAVWTACLLFFQGVLLCGYFYAHSLTKLSSIRQQVTVHVILLCISLAFLPIGLQDVLRSESVVSPLASIVMLLAGVVGLPYFLLSATGPLVQRWLSYGNAKVLPYKLYSLSNLGSVLALISYPFLFEPLFALTSQTVFWSIGYSIFSLFMVTLCFKLFKTNVPIPLAEETDTETWQVDRVAQISLWLLLSAVGVVLLVSTTNAMTQNIPPVPFLWVLPLFLYLLTFIISFHNARWYVRWYWFSFFSVSAFAAIMMFFIGSYFNAITQVVVYSIILFSSCMVCHGELARLKPGISRLTLFYLMLSLGGFLGSVFVAFVAQNSFSSFLEFPLAILCLFVLFSSCIYWHKLSSAQSTGSLSLLMAKVSIVLAVCLFGFFAYMQSLFNGQSVIATRNFYGVLQVRDVEVEGRLERRLIDGTTSHGTQSLEPALEHIAMSYYRENTGVALALAHDYGHPLNVGLIGLGAGTLAAYGQKGDNYHFYELNPAVESIAKSHFSYLEKTQANLSVTLGDARISLTREFEVLGSQEYNILVVDAFSGDSIPTHLLTKEAFELYWQHLAGSGVLAVHVTNSHLNLTSLVKNIAALMDKQSFYFETDAVINSGVNQAQWVIVTNNNEFIKSSHVKRFISSWPKSKQQHVIWTDDYTNLLSVLK